MTTQTVKIPEINILMTDDLKDRLDVSTDDDYFHILRKLSGDEDDFFSFDELNRRMTIVLSEKEISRLFEKRKENPHYTITVHFFWKTFVLKTDVLEITKENEKFLVKFFVEGEPV
jgi:hypothetical protein